MTRILFQNLKANKRTNTKTQKKKKTPLVSPKKHQQKKSKSETLTLFSKRQRSSPKQKARATKIQKESIFPRTTKMIKRAKNQKNQRRRKTRLKTNLRNRTSILLKNFDRIWMMLKKISLDWRGELINSQK